MESEWSGNVEGSFFNGEMFDKCRRLLLPEDLYSSKSSKDGYYVISCDVGRRLCLTAITVIKVSPLLSGASLKSIVNMYIMEDEHFEDQAIKLKLLYFQFKARVIVIDGNGLIKLLM